MDLGLTRLRAHATAILVAASAALAGAAAAAPFGGHHAPLVPAEACGTVVQLAAQADTTPFAARFASAETDGPLAGPAWWPPPPPRAAVAAELCRVVLRTPDRSGARRFFGDLLGGGEAASGARTTELVWPGGGRLCLEDHDGAPGIDRLELAGPAPERRVAGTRVVGA